MRRYIGLRYKEAKRPDQQEFLDKQLSHALAEVGEFKRAGSSCCKRMMAWSAISRRSKI